MQNEKYELIALYVEHIIEGMDMDTLVGFVQGVLTERLEEKELSEIKEEVQSFAPHLLD